MSCYKNSIEKIQKYLEKHGVEKNIIHSSFIQCHNENKLYALTNLYDFYNRWSTVYFEEDDELIGLKYYEVPSKIVEFYRNYEPNEVPCLEGGIRLLSLDEIKDENSNSSPGAYLIKYGLITIATTLGGNAICMDLNKLVNGEPRILYADCSWFSFNDKERKVEVNFYPYKIDECEDFLTNKIIEKYLPQISKSFEEFLDMLASGEEWDAEDFYDLVGSCN